MLKGKQKKLDANKDGEISGDDFKMLRSKKGMNVGGSMSDKEDSYFQKEMKRKTSESKDKGRISDRELEFIGKMKPEMKSKGELKDMAKRAFERNTKNLKGSLSDRELEIISRMQPEMKSKGGSIFSRKNYKRTGKI
jgi:hypothetical protein